MSLRNLREEPTKQNAGESQARWVQAQQVPWTTGLKIAENGGTINLSHVLANDCNEFLSRQNGCPIWRTKWFDAGGLWRLDNDWHDCGFWCWIGKAEDGTEA